MTRDQAEEIHRHLLDAADAMSRAEAAIAEAGDDARKALARYLDDVSVSLHWGLLTAIYRNFPDLRPPPTEIPTICSELRWEEVTLPPFVSEVAIDQIIFADCGRSAARWR